MEHWEQESIEALTSHPPANDGENGENYERHQHDCRTLVNTTVAVWRVCPRMLLMRMLSPCHPAILSKERHEPLPEHVERSQESREQTNGPENPTSIRTGQGVIKNCVLTEEACERPK